MWTIKKRYKHINALHQQLRVFRASLNFPFPTRSHKERRASFRNNYSTEMTDKPSGKKKRMGALPRFPNRPESLVTVESLPDRMTQLQEYLYNLLNIRLYRNHHETVSKYYIIILCQVHKIVNVFFLLFSRLIFLKCHSYHLYQH